MLAEMGRDHQGLSDVIDRVRPGPIWVPMIEVLTRPNGPLDQSEQALSISQPLRGQATPLGKDIRHFLREPASMENDRQAIWG